MSEPQKAEHIPTLQELAAVVAQLRERIEDLEDSREIDAAIRRNGDKPWFLGSRPRRNSV